jgi:8-oxo-dGTP pyrophosphatase MutT (NUDIX family)
VTAPTGIDGIYGVVQFKQRAIGVVPIDAEGYTWLVGQQRYTLGRYSWEIPEGGAPFGESALGAAQRELREETGLIARKWTSLLKLNTSNSVTDEEALSFVAQNLIMGEVAPDETEVLSVRRLPLIEAVEMVIDGRITDALAMTSLLKVQLMLDRGQLSLS